MFESSLMNIRPDHFWGFWQEASLKYCHLVFFMGKTVDRKNRDVYAQKAGAETSATRFTQKLRWIKITYGLVLNGPYVKPDALHLGLRMEKVSRCRTKPTIFVTPRSDAHVILLLCSLKKELNDVWNEHFHSAQSKEVSCLHLKIIILIPGTLTHDIRSSTQQLFERKPSPPRLTIQPWGNDSLNCHPRPSCLTRQLWGSNLHFHEHRLVHHHLRVMTLNSSNSRLLLKLKPQPLTSRRPPCSKIAPKPR